MNWIKTESISVPAHANQITEVAINEWFNNNRSFLLGTPVANQLRGTAGGWAQTMAVAPIENQNTVSLLRDRLSQILKMAKGDVPRSPSLSAINAISNKSYGDTNTMATIIPADKFESSSAFAFILRENAKPHGIEIHFPPDSSPDASFIGRIAAAGFEKARTNPDLWYCNYSETAMTKARGWVKACQKNGAYEISPNEPVEQTKSRRRGGAKQAASPTPTPVPTPTAAPATPVGGNKIVDAIADRVQQMLDSMKAELTVDTSELYVLRTENERLKAELQESNESRQKYREALEAKVDEVKCLEQDRDRANETINRQRESIDMAVSEVARLGDIVEERDRVITSLRQQLAEWGVVEVESEPAAPVFEDEPEVEAPVFDDEPPVFDDEPAINAPNFDDEEVVELGEPPLDSSSEPEPDDTSEGEGFDFDSLGEI